MASNTSPSVGSALADAAANGHHPQTQLDLSLIIPTRNEAGNIEALVKRLDALPLSMQIVFVDDSDDGTPAAVNAMQGASRHQILFIHRPAGHRHGGLGGAVLQGMQAASADIICVMDADLQHPPEIIPTLLAKAADADLVLASRFLGHAERQGLSRPRETVSRTFIAMAGLLFPRRLRHVTDPLTGFFLFRRDAVAVEDLRPNGFKILLEILVRTPNLRVAEVPFTFGTRLAGESKASAAEARRFFVQVYRLRFQKVSGRAMRFAAVGLSGILVNTLALAFFTDVSGIYYLVSALLATQVSTLWNFSLTEAWVYPASDSGRSRRLGLFLLMNNAAMALRGPALFVLVSGLGMNYILANVLSLGALTVLRFALSDIWIWRQQERPLHAYDIHGLISITSEVALPELEKFRKKELATEPSVTVRIGRVRRAVRLEEGRPATRTIVYREVMGRLGFATRIEAGDHVSVTASPLLRHSPHVLYTNVVEPILRWMFVQRGYALVHGACVASLEEHSAYLITARTDTGKTTTILRTLDQRPCAFLSDDLTLVNREGAILTYPKPLTISRHTLQAVRTPLLSLRERVMLIYQSRIHSRTGRGVAKWVAAGHLPAATINTIVQWLIPPPKYHVERLVPGVASTDSARLKRLVVIERGPHCQAVLPHAEVVDVLLSNCEDAYGFPPYPTIARFLYEVDGRDLRTLEREIVRDALSGIPATLLRSESMDWWRQVAEIVDGDGDEVTVPGGVALPSALPAGGS